MEQKLLTPEFGKTEPLICTAQYFASICYKTMLNNYIIIIL